MVDYKKEAQMIVSRIIATERDPLVDIAKRVEDRLRQLAHIEHMQGYCERQREEIDRHNKLRENINELRDDIVICVSCGKNYIIGHICTCGYVPHGNDLRQRLQDIKK